MKKTRVLYVSQEITPFLPKSELSEVARNLPQGIHEKGKEIRVFMPRYGSINERRHQLHEVIRLSGMNLVVNDTDHPLIIKVASIPTARMQVYFIDNEDFFHRKAVFEDKNTGEFFKDNDERSIFFCRGVLETVRKLGWAPDVIHCHGWFTSLLPLYVKKFYNDDPHFSDAKIVFSAYEDGFDGSLDKNLVKKLKFDGFSEEDITGLDNPTFEALNKFAFRYSDGIIEGSEELPEGIKNAIEASDKSTMEYCDLATCVKTYSDFYDEIVEQNSVLVE